MIIRIIACNGWPIKVQRGGATLAVQRSLRHRPVDFYLYKKVKKHESDNDGCNR